MSTTESATRSINVASRLTRMAAHMPAAPAVIVPGRRGPDGRRTYRRYSFRELDVDSSRLAAGLLSMGVVPGTRLALLVRPGFDFISLVFALFKSGAVQILIDPGMGLGRLLACLDDVQPEGFVAIPAVHAVRSVMPRRFAAARYNVTVGRRWFWGRPTIDRLRARHEPLAAPVATAPDDPAAIIFTTGSTGPPKGVQYTHGNFDAQVDELRNFYGIEPGEIDLPCFPLFALFNCALGATAVIPQLDPSRPVRVDPQALVETANDCGVTQAFGSPAVWNKVGRWCRDHGRTMPTLRRVFSAGAPVPVDVLETMMGCIHPAGEVHTPYGATESLPVASIAADEVISDTAAASRAGAGTCVGRRFPGIDWRVIRIIDGPIARFADAEPLPTGEIGELIVRGPVVTARYVTRVGANAGAKIADGHGFWHRMGDAGYLDGEGRFWFCGRVAHRVQTSDGPMYTVRCEAIFNAHPAIARAALVGVGAAGRQRPVIVAEPLTGRMPRTADERAKLTDELRELGRGNRLTASIDDFLLHASLPVDVRHNSKIFREQLAVWAARKLG